MQPYYELLRGFLRYLTQKCWQPHIKGQNFAYIFVANKYLLFVYSIQFLKNLLSGGMYIIITYIYFYSLSLLNIQKNQLQQFHCSIGTINNSTYYLLECDCRYTTIYNRVSEFLSKSSQKKVHLHKCPFFNSESRYNLIFQIE